MKKFLLLILISSSLAFAQNVKTTLTYLVHKPAKVNKNTQVLIVMHGYGSDETDLFPFSKDVAKDFLIFSLQGPRMVSRGGYCWYDLEFLPQQKFKYDYKQTEEARKKVLAFISAACIAYKADSTKVFLMGFSQGASLAYDISIAAPQKIKGAVCLSGLIPTETQTLKTDWEKVTTVKYFIAHGTTDNVVNLNDAKKCSEFIKSKKVADVSFSTYPVGHSLDPTEIKDVFNWLEKNKK